uniref:Exuperantia [Bombyx mori] n=1 Tax=Lepeophtheirus salmonis TaxID=72036 RepID=A0A0K2TU80_LEPSM
MIVLKLGKRIPKEVMSLKDELPFGNYSLIFIDIDFFDLKSKLRTEMCQIGAYISNGTSMQGFIKPKDHNMLTHSNFYEVIEGRSYYKNPRDFNMHLMLSQKEVLINFLGFIEKSHDINYFDGVLILSLSDEATPYLLKALKKYDLFRRFEKRVKGIGDLYSHLQVTNPILYSDILVPLFSKIYSKLMGRKENTCLLYSCQHKAMLLEKMTTKFLSGEVPTYSNFYSFVIKPIGSSVLKRAATLETIEERMESCLPLALYISNKLSLFQTFHKKKKKVTRDRIVFDFCRILLDGELDFKMMLKTYSDQGARDLEMKIWSIVLERMNSFSKDVEVYNQIIDVTLEYFHNFCGILVKPKETPKLNFNNNNLSSKLKKVHKASTEILASSNLTNEDLHDTYFKLSSEIKSSRILKYRFKEYLGDKIKASFSKLSNPPFGFSMFLEHMYTLYCIGPTPILTPKIREDFFKFISKYYRSEQGIQIYFKSFKPLEDSIRRSFMPFMSKGLKKKLKYSTRISKCISLILSYESLSLDIIKGYNDHEIFSMILNIFSNHQIPGVAPLYVVNIIRNFLAEGSK